MILNILGSTGSIQATEASNTSLAVTSAGRTVLIDVSGSPVQSLKRSAIDPVGVDLLFLTHAHIDHIYALPSLIHQLWLSGRVEDLTIVANEETIQVAQSLCDLFALADKKGIFAIDWQVAQEGKPMMTVGEMSIEFFSVPHGIPTLGCALVEGDKKIVYLADCKPSDSYPPCAYDADLIIHEAGGVAAEEERIMGGGHSSARQAALAANHLGAQRLILAHLPCEEDERQQLLAEAQAHGASTELPRLFEPYHL